MANFSTSDEVIFLGDRQMPTEENQWTWLRLGLGLHWSHHDAGPSLPNPAGTVGHRSVLGRATYVAQQEAHESPEKRTIY
ncbi:hypothetical protein [Thermogutta sp.]|uniref:hypothetical protein n=1 Tax=Thermogutta sp. TaxID=1962930 RepID=UPI003220376F